MQTFSYRAVYTQACVPLHASNCKLPFNMEEFNMKAHSLTHIATRTHMHYMHDSLPPHDVCKGIIALGGKAF